MSADPVASGTIVVTTEQGIYRTTNGGSAWTQQLSGLFWAGSLSRSPASASTLYALEQPNAPQQATSANASVYLSTDGGITWNPQGALPAGFVWDTNIAGIVADPLNAATAYVFSFISSNVEAILKTTDSGQTWIGAAPGPNPFVTSMVGGSDGSLYATWFTSGASGVYKSTNQGGTWAEIDNGLPYGATLWEHSISVSAANPSILYLAAGTQIYTTTNGGSSWSAVSPTPGSQSTSLATAVAVSPLNSSIVYTWNTFAYMSTDGGNTWTYAGLPGITLNAFAFESVEHRARFRRGGRDERSVRREFEQRRHRAHLVDVSRKCERLAGFWSCHRWSGQCVRYRLGRKRQGGFPTTSGALEASLTNGSAFVAEISNTGTSCTYTVKPAAQTVITGGGQLAWFTLVAPSSLHGGTRRAIPHRATFPYGASGTGIVVIPVQATTNSTGSSRTANLMIGGQTVTLTQASASCAYSIEPGQFLRASRPEARYR